MRCVQTFKKWTRRNRDIIVNIERTMADAAIQYIFIYKCVKELLSLDDNPRMIIDFPVFNIAPHNGHHVADDNLKNIL